MQPMEYVHIRPNVYDPDKVGSPAAKGQKEGSPKTKPTQKRKSTGGSGAYLPQSQLQENQTRNASRLDEPTVAVYSKYTKSVFKGKSEGRR